MPDYAACAQSKCDHKYSCARYMMKKGNYQTFINPDVENCGHYWDILDGVPFKLDEQLLKEKENEQ